MTFALATVGCGLPQAVSVALAAALAWRGRHRAPRAARWAFAASLIQLLLVVADLGLLGGADLARSLSYATEQRLNTVSEVLVLLSVLGLAPLLYAVQLDRSLRLPSFRQTPGPAAAIPPRTRPRWEQVLPPSDPGPGGPQPASRGRPGPPAR